MTQSVVPATRCEDILRASKRYNLENNILRSHNEVIDCLLERRVEMKAAYRELSQALTDQTALKVLLEIAVNTAAFRGFDQSVRLRQAKKEIQETNAAIAKKSAELAVLFDRRLALEASGFDSATHYHIVGVISEAAASNGLYANWIKDNLHQMSVGFDLKYWPSLADILRTLAVDASRSEVNAVNETIAVFTSGQRPSKVDFFKAFFSEIDQSSKAFGGLLPAGFRLSDEAVASIANCALNLEASELVDGAYVKRLRQRARESAAGK